MNTHVARADLLLRCPNPVHHGERVFLRTGVDCPDCDGSFWRVKNPHEAVEILATEGILPEAATDHRRWRWKCSWCNTGDCPRCRHRCGLRNRPPSIEALMRAVAFGPETLLRLWELARVIFPEIEGVGWGVGYPEQPALREARYEQIRHRAPRHTLHARMCDLVWWQQERAQGRGFRPEGVTPQAEQAMRDIQAHGALLLNVTGLLYPTTESIPAVVIDLSNVPSSMFDD